MERKVFLGLLTATILLGAYLRLVDLTGPSLWLDEILHLHVTQSLADEPWYRHVTGVQEIKGGTENGPLYYRLQIWGQRLAPGDAGVRLFPALVGILTLPLMVFAAKCIGGRLLALCATFLLAVAPLHVYFSREGRPYYLLMAMALGLIYALLQPGSRQGRWLAYLSCLVTTYVGLHALPLLLSFSALAGFAGLWSLKSGHTLRRSPYLHHLIAGLVALGMAYSFYLTQTTTNTPVLDPAAKQTTFEESPVFTSPWSAKSLRLFTASMTVSGHPEAPVSRRAWVFMAFAVLGFAVTVRRRPIAMFMVVGMFILPTVLSLLALVSVGRWYGMRYTSAALPAFLLLVALGCVTCAEWIVNDSKVRHRTLGGWACNVSPSRRIAITWSTAALLLVLIAAPNVQAALADPQRKADWREVAEIFAQVAIDGEAVVIPNDWPRICLDYYLQKLDKQVEFVKVWESVDLARQEVAQRPHGWLMTAGFRRNNKVRRWMHQFVPVINRRQEELGLFFFPDVEAMLQTRFAADQGVVFERRFAAMGQRFEFAGGEGILQSRGWSRSETLKEQELSFQWAQGAQVALGLPISQPRDASMHLRILPFNYPGAPPQQVDVVLNETLVASLELPPRWSEQQVSVPASAWSPGANLLYLRFARSTRPADVNPGSKDRRLLSAAFDYLELLPISE